MLLLSIAFGLIPLVGVAWLVMQSSLTTVDGLFTSLILLALSGIIFLNMFLSLRKRTASKTQKTS
jgi:hypothetical protein